MNRSIVGGIEISAHRSRTQFFSPLARDFVLEGAKRRGMGEAGFVL
jgi:hypothetical protein